MFFKAKKLQEQIYELENSLSDTKNRLASLEGKITPLESKVSVIHNEVDNHSEGYEATYKLSEQVEGIKDKINRIKKIL